MKHEHDIGLYNHLICESAIQNIGSDEYHSEPIFKDNDAIIHDMIRVKWKLVLLEKVHFDALNIDSLILNLKKNDFIQNPSNDHKLSKIKYIGDFKIKMSILIENSILNLGVYLDFLLNKNEDMSNDASQVGLEFGQSCNELNTIVLSCVKLEQ